MRGVREYVGLQLGLITQGSQVQILPRYQSRFVRTPDLERPGVLSFRWELSLRALVANVAVYSVERTSSVTPRGQVAGFAVAIPVEAFVDLRYHM